MGEMDWSKHWVFEDFHLPWKTSRRDEEGSSHIQAANGKLFSMCDLDDGAMDNALNEAVVAAINAYQSQAELLDVAGNTVDAIAAYLHEPSDANRWLLEQYSARLSAAGDRVGSVPVEPVEADERNENSGRQAVRPATARRPLPVVWRRLPGPPQERLPGEGLPVYGVPKEGGTMREIDIQEWRQVIGRMDPCEGAPGTVDVFFDHPGPPDGVTAFFLRMETANGYRFLRENLPALLDRYEALEAVSGVADDMLQAWLSARTDFTDFIEADVPEAVWNTIGRHALDENSMRVEAALAALEGRAGDKGEGADG